MQTTSVFLRDAYGFKPRSSREALGERIRTLRMQLWADPGDKTGARGHDRAG
jgi:hypothetical protein